jgi:hypothetical protein
MKKLSETYKELGIDFTFPIVIMDADCNPTYYETIDGFWSKREYDSNSHRTYYESSTGRKEGTPRSQSCAGKIIEVDGKKYKLTEL